jgi:hypothetical protein
MYTSTGTAVQVLQPYRSTSYNAGELDENDDAKVYAAPPPCQAPVVCRRAERARQGLAAAISSRPRVRVRRQTPRDSYPFSDAQCQSLTPAARFSLRQNPMGILLGQNFRCCKRNVLVITLFGLSLLYSYSYCTLDMNRLIQLAAAARWRLLISAAAHRVIPPRDTAGWWAHPGFWLRDQ